MYLQGPDEMPHGRVVLTMDRYEAEALADFLVDEYQAGRFGVDDDLGDLAFLLAPLAGYRTCDGCGALEDAGGPEQDGEGRSACCVVSVRAYRTDRAESAHFGRKAV